jgi:hypothetical protein
MRTMTEPDRGVLRIVALSGPSPPAGGLIYVEPLVCRSALASIAEHSHAARPTRRPS